MTESHPAVLPTLMPVDWNGPLTGIRVAMTPVDEFDQPMERRGVMARIPSDRRDYPKYADDIAEVVRRTVLFMLTGEAPKEAA